MSRSTWNSLLYNNVLTSVMAYHERALHTGTTETRYLFHSVLHWSDWSEFMTQTSKLVSLDITIVCIFIQFVLAMSLFSISVWCRGILSPYSTVLLPMTVVLSIGCGGSIGHAHMTSWGGKVMLGLWSNLEKLFGPQHICSYIWLFPDRPCTEGIISKWVWYIACRLYHI